MRRLGLAVVVALALPGAALANGDPASDVIPVAQVFLPFEAPISKSAADGLRKTVEEANSKGYQVRVAVIAFSGDLGMAGSLWGKPNDYAKFLGSEISFAYPNRLLIAMPSGFGVYNGKKPVAKELRVLRSVRPGKTPTELTDSAARAVRALAAGDGITVPKPSTDNSATRDRVILGIAVLAFLLVLVFPARLLRRRARGAEQSPSAGPR